MLYCCPTSSRTSPCSLHLATVIIGASSRSESVRDLFVISRERLTVPLPLLEGKCRRNDGRSKVDYPRIMFKLVLVVDAETRARCRG